MKESSIDTNAIETIKYKKKTGKMVIKLMGGGTVVIDRPELTGNIDVTRDSPDDDFLEWGDTAAPRPAQYPYRPRISGSFSFIKAESVIFTPPPPEEDQWWEWDYKTIPMKSLTSANHSEAVEALHGIVSFTEKGEWGRYFGKKSDRAEFLRDVEALVEKWGKR